MRQSNCLQQPVHDDVAAIAIVACLCADVAALALPACICAAAVAQRVHSARGYACMSLRCCALSSHVSRAPQKLAPNACHVGTSVRASRVARTSFVAGSELWVRMYLCAMPGGSVLQLLPTCVTHVLKAYLPACTSGAGTVDCICECENSAHLYSLVAINGGSWYKQAAAYPTQEQGSLKIACYACGTPSTCTLCRPLRCIAHALWILTFTHTPTRQWSLGSSSQERLCKYARHKQCLTRMFLLVCRMAFPCALSSAVITVTWAQHSGCAITRGTVCFRHSGNQSPLLHRCASCTNRPRVDTDLLCAARIGEAQNPGPPKLRIRGKTKMPPEDFLESFQPLPVAKALSGVVQTSQFE
eukprot:134508-Amphidinium_carterae.1